MGLAHMVRRDGVAYFDCGRAHDITTSSRRCIWDLSELENACDRFTSVAIQ
jgi:hypothetical protein